jgi:peroxiredoxin
MSDVPDFRLPSNKEGNIGLGDYLGKSNLYLFFIREYNWMQCRYHAGQLGQLYPQFKALNCEVLLVLGDSIKRAGHYAQILHLNYPVLADPERKVYHQYGLEKAAILIQRTASVVIDFNGVIRYINTTTSPMIWLQESKKLLDIIKQLPEPT